MALHSAESRSTHPTVPVGKGAAQHTVQGTLSATDEEVAARNGSTLAGATDPVATIELPVGSHSSFQPDQSTGRRWSRLRLASPELTLPILLSDSEEEWMLSSDYERDKEDAHIPDGVTVHSVATPIHSV